MNEYRNRIDNVDTPLNMLIQSLLLFQCVNVTTYTDDLNFMKLYVSLSLNLRLALKNFDIEVFLNRFESLYTFLLVHTVKYLKIFKFL